MSRRPLVLKDHLNFLERHFKPRVRLSIRLVSIKTLKKHSADADEGVSWIKSRTGHILLLRGMSETRLTTTLIHEWAHILRAQMSPMWGDSFHDPIFALIENRIWSAWQEETPTYT